MLGDKGNKISKYPPAFDIELHIDDSPGVAMEGVRHQFATIIIEEADLQWEQAILCFLEEK